MASPFLPINIDYPKTEDEQQIRNFLIDTFTNVNTAVNNKEIAEYFPVETQTGQSWFQKSSTNQLVNGFRISQDVGPLPGVAGNKGFPHNIAGIQPGYRITNAWAIANRPKPFSAIPLQIVEITSMQAIINVTASAINYPSCILVIEYTKSS